MSLDVTMTGAFFAGLLSFADRILEAFPSLGRIVKPNLAETEGEQIIE